MELGVLFESKSGKYLQLIPGNARFLSSADQATPIEKSKFDDELERSYLLDHHNVDWYFHTIKWIPVSNQTAA